MKKYVMPIIYTILIVILGSLLTSILYYFNITSDKLNKIFLYLISIIGIFIGAINISKIMSYKGMVNGLIYFIGWFIVLFILSLIMVKSKFNVGSLIYYAILLIFSVLGGILGKNLNEENGNNN